MADISGYYLWEKQGIEQHIPVGKNIVLEIGCAAGRLGKRLRERNKVDRIIGIELFEPAAREAKKIYDEVIVGDIESIELNYSNYFDFVICGDVLEHLKEPDAILKKIHGMLKMDGVLIVTIPNIQHYSVIFNLLFKGSWEYRDAGIMDKTHLRFFTRKSFSRVLLDNNYSIIVCQGLIPRKSQILNFLTCHIFRDFFNYQLIYKCCRNSRAPSSKAN